MAELSEQEKYGPNGICFGCGPINEKGLRIRSFWEGEDFVLRYTPKKEHRAFKGAINGGIIGALFDCHSNWLAASTLYKQNPDEDFPSTVTSVFSVKLKRPTPVGVELLINAKIVKIDGNRVTTYAEMFAGDKLTSTCEAVFVSVPKGHLAHHRWQ